MSGQSPQERVLVIDASATVRREACARLAAAGFTVLADGDTGGLDRTVKLYQPDLVVVDANGGRFDIVVGLVRSVRRVPVIVLVADRSLARRLDAFEAGVDDVLVKPFAIEELLARAVAVLERSGRRQTTIHVADVTIDEAAHTATRAGEPLELTGTEFDLLAALARNSGLVMSKRALLSTVWGFEHYHVNVVEVHVCALRRKLEALGPRLIQTVRGVGYVFRVPAPSAAERTGVVALAGPAAGAAS
jgi:two-component system, OmpR family, response regulator